MKSIFRVLLLACIFLMSGSLLAQRSTKIYLDKNLQVTSKKQKKVYYEERVMNDNGELKTTIYDMKGQATGLERKHPEKSIKVGPFNIKSDNPDNSISGRYRKEGENKYKMVLAPDEKTISVSYEGNPLPAEYLVLFNDHSARQEKHFKNSRRSGTWKSWYANGKQRSEIEFENDIARGFAKMWHEDGSLMLVVEPNGVEDQRTFTSYYSNGQVYQETILDGQDALNVPIFIKPDYEDDALLRVYVPTGQNDMNTYQENGHLKEQAFHFDSLGMKATKHVYFDAEGEVERITLDLKAKDTKQGIYSIFDGHGNLTKRIYSEGEEFMAYEFTSPTDSVFVKPTEKSTVSGAADEETLFHIVEKMPEYPEGERAMFQFIGERMRYPNMAKEFGIQGVVFLNFTVEKDGSIGYIRCLRSPDTSLTLESARVLHLMPKWKPGMQKGKAVNVSFHLPYRFILQ